MLISLQKCRQQQFNKFFTKVYYTIVYVNMNRFRSMEIQISLTGVCVDTAPKFWLNRMCAWREEKKTLSIFFHGRTVCLTEKIDFCEVNAKIPLSHVEWKKSQNSRLFFIRFEFRSSSSCIAKHCEHFE